MHQEIKLLFLVLFTVYTIYKINKVINMPRKIASQEDTSTQSSEKGEEREKSKLTEKEAIAEFDNELFPYICYGLPANNFSFPLQTAISPIPRFSSSLNTSFSTCQKSERGNDINDIFGGNYNQCHEGKILDADGKIPIYNRGCFEIAPFRRETRPTMLPSNGEFQQGICRYLTVHSDQQQQEIEINQQQQQPSRQVICQQVVFTDLVPATPKKIVPKRKIIYKHRIRTLDPTKRLKEKSTVARRQRKGKNVSSKKSKYATLIWEQIIRKEAQIELLRKLQIRKL